MITPSLTSRSASSKLNIFREDMHESKRRNTLFNLNPTNFPFPSQTAQIMKEAAFFFRSERISIHDHLTTFFLFKNHKQTLHITAQSSSGGRNTCFLSPFLLFWGLEFNRRKNGATRICISPVPVFHHTIWSFLPPSFFLFLSCTREVGVDNGWKGGRVEGWKGGRKEELGGCGDRIARLRIDCLPCLLAYLAIYVFVFLSLSLTKESRNACMQLH